MMNKRDEKIEEIKEWIQSSTHPMLMALPTVVNIHDEIKGGWPSTLAGDALEIIKDVWRTA